MSTTVLDMIGKAGVDLAQAETIFVWIDDRAGVVSLADATRWLSRMAVFDDYTDPGWDGHSTLPRNAIYGAQIWLPSHIVRTIEVDGIYRLQWISTTPEMLMRQISRQQLMPIIDLGTGRTWKDGEPT